MLKQYLEEMREETYKEAYKKAQKEIDYWYDVLVINEKTFEELFEINPVLEKNFPQKVVFNIGKVKYSQYKIGDGKTPFRDLPYEETNNTFAIIQKLQTQKNQEKEQKEDKKEITTSENLKSKFTSSFRLYKLRNGRICILIEDCLISLYDNTTYFCENYITCKLENPNFETVWENYNDNLSHKNNKNYDIISVSEKILPLSLIKIVQYKIYPSEYEWEWTET